MNNLRLSKESICDFCGDIVTLHLISCADISHENIIWKSSDETICSIRDFKGEGEDNFSDGVLLIMMGVGECVVSAEYKGKVYECKISSVPMKKADPKKDKFNFYFCDFHSHTSNNHNREEFPKRCDTIPIDVLNEVKNEGFLDGFTISDHSDLVTDREFFRVFLSAEEAQSHDFICFPGTESEITDVEYDIHGYPHKNSGEAVTFNSHGYACTKNWDDYFKKVVKNPCAVASFAHPQILGWSVKGIWNFAFGRKVCPEMINLFRMIEVGNGGDRAQNLVHERMYSYGLDYGLKLSTVSTSDWHGPKWGKTSCRGKTILLSPQKSKEMFLDAILNNRFYATESGNVKLWYTVNNEILSQTLDLTDTYKFHVEISHFTKPEDGEKSFLLEVISDFGKTVKTIDIDPSENVILDFEVKSETARYFYLKITSVDGDRTWSSPVWTGRECEKVSNKKFDMKVIDRNDWKVISSSCEKNTEKIISGEYTDPWVADDTKAEFVIDLNKTQKISAIGIYPHTVSRDDETLSDTESTARFVSDYEMYLGDENNNFILVSKDTVRSYGEEKIDEFEACDARYIKIKILSTAGSSQYKKKYMQSPVMIGNIYAYTK